MKFDDDMVDNSKSALETLVRTCRTLILFGLSILMIIQIRVGMSIGHSPGRAAHSPDMRKENPTMEEKQDAKRRIEGSTTPDGVQGPMAGTGQ